MTRSLQNRAPDATTGQVLRRTISAVRYELGTAWRHDRTRTALMITLILLQALLPAIQVVMVNQLIGALSVRGATISDAAGWLLGTVLAAGIAIPMSEVMGTLHSQSAEVSEELSMTQLAHGLADLTPVQIADPNVVELAEQARVAASLRAHVPVSAIQLVGNLVTAVSLAIALWTLSPLAGAIALLVLVPTLYGFSVVARREVTHWPQVVAPTRKANYLLDQLKYQRTATELATLGAGRRMADLASMGFRERLTRFLALLAKNLRLGVITAAITAALLGAALVGLVVGSGGGAAAAAGIVGLVGALTALRQTGYAFGLLMQGAPKTQAWLAFRALGTAQPYVPVVRRTELVELHDVSVRYPGAAEPAVTGITLQARRGEMIALVGVNGAGKTTTVAALAGLVELSAGQVRIDGVDVAGWPIAQRLAHLGLLTQEFGRYELTVRESLSLAAPGLQPTDEQLWSALEAAHAADLVRGLPDGLDTQLGAQFKGVGLSGGQWQRLSLARIALRDAGIWVLDEPTSAIDAEAEAQIFAELLRTKADRITIVVSHRAWTLKGMDRIHVFDQGRIVQQGRYEELIVQPGRFAEIFAEQT